MITPAFSVWIEDFVARNDGVAGTVHKLEGAVLVLVGTVNIPPFVVEKTRRIAQGKGMAGLAWERGEPVQTCNLKTDTTGDVRPGAKAVDAKAAIALPISAQGQFVGVVGIAFDDTRELEPATVARLTRDAEAAALL